MSNSECVRKGEFAELIGVSAARVSQYIKDGQISGDALIGEGRNARIHVEKAKGQLGLLLDVSQRTGNGAGTRLEPKQQAAEQPTAPTAQDRIMAEKLRQAEIATARLQREELAAAGVYMRTSDARAEMEQIAGSMLKVLEGALPKMATDLAAKHGVSQRDALHTLRATFAKVRADAAERHGLDRDQQEQLTYQAAETDGTKLAPRGEA